MFKMHLTLLICCFAILVTFTTSTKLCNSYRPNCGLTSKQSRERLLTPYAQIFPKLRAIKRRSKFPVQIGPLIKESSTKWGIFNIDTKLNLGLSPAVNVSICGKGTSPSIRQAIICSVTNDAVAQPPRGNLNASKIGYSTQGRRIYAARLGKRGGIRVLITTQLHGNEPAGTEGGIRLLNLLTTNKKFATSLLTTLDIVIIFRVNPDAGEPTGEFPLLGVPFQSRSGFFRQNIDPTAGGGFIAPSEPGFFGVVGRGYDLNRYNYAGFYDAIRPVESQAIVGALHSFVPNFVYDLHGDLPKVICAPDSASLKPNAVLGVVPSFECLPPAPKVPSLATSRKNMVISTFFGDDATVLDGPGTEGITSALNFPRIVRTTRSILGALNNGLRDKIVGFISRYSFPIPARNATKLFSDGTVDRGAMRLGAVAGGWEVLNFVPQVRAAVDGLRILPNGTAVPSVTADSTDIEPCFMRDNICLHFELLKRTLNAVRKFALKQRVFGDNGYCTIPTDDGVVTDFPTGEFGDLSTDGPVLIPQAGKFNVPSEISGACAGDLV